MDTNTNIGNLGALTPRSKRCASTPELSNFSWEEVESVEEVSADECYDLCILESDVYAGEPNYVAGGFLVHNSGFHDLYCDRKNGKEAYELHPLLKPILDKTYGVMCFQEQITRIFNILGDISLVDCETVRKAISKKDKGKMEKYKEQFVRVGQKKLGVDQEYMEKMYDQLEAFSEYAFNLSHACAYTYITARMLWQKVYYPLEFYAAGLRGLKTGDERIIDYIRDARKRDIHAQPVDVNRSRQDFEIVDDKIYFGFGKIKGVGDETADRAVAGQPYADIRDFLVRFGTDEKVLQPLIALDAFKGRDRMTTYFFYKAYKKLNRQNIDRRQRHKKSLAKYFNELKILAGDWAHGFDDTHFGALRSRVDDAAWAKLCKLKKRHDKSADTFAEKDGRDIALDPKTFDPRTVKLNKGGLKTFRAVKPTLTDDTGATAERAFYGFPWVTDFERLPDYQGQTFEEYEADLPYLTPGNSLPVEVRIESVDHATSKSGKMQYYKLRVTDGGGADTRSVTVWEHDYNMFESLLQPGNLVRLRLLPPQDPYPNFSLEGEKPWELRRKPVFSEFDTRVVLLKRAEKKKVAEDDDALLADIFTEDGEDI